MASIRRAWIRRVRNCSNGSWVWAIDRATSVEATFSLPSSSADSAQARAKRDCQAGVNWFRAETPLAKASAEACQSFSWAET